MNNDSISGSVKVPEESVNLTKEGGGVNSRRLTPPHVLLIAYLVTRSSQLTMANITPIETKHTPRKTVQATQIGHAL